MHPPQYLERPEGRLAYDDQGTGPLVVLVPGLGDLRSEYRFLAPQLVEAGFRVISLDLRGHGQSDMGWSDYRASAVGSDVIALIEHLNEGPALIVGTSMGAAAAVWAAAERREAVAGLALVGPFVRDVPQPLHKRLLQGAMLRLVLSNPLAPKLWGAAFRSFHRILPADFDEHRARLVANLSEPGRLDALRGMIFASKAEIEARLALVKAPVRVVMGTADPDFADPAAEAAFVAQRLGGSIMMVEGAGHYPHVESPGPVAADLVAFFKRVR
ncbi:alpha/beta fold hydrolase [Arsenicitalea aurantiaca]|uniref:alpha/beta fold hydrolase n=1 Tax=Arsenicitalea aurantiaca TaxID=1783274 RepID=UPI001315871E|nr:alpha/beta hydrolase [Arsenicitalea aurantiaca]